MSSCVTGLILPEVDSHFFGFVDVQDQVVSVTPVHQLHHLLSVGTFVVVPDESHYCCVVRVFDERFVEDLGTQSWIIRVKRSRLRTHP